MSFFFSWFSRFYDDFALCRTFRYDAQFSCGHVCSTCEGVAAFAALPDAYALASNFDEAALGALVGGFESGDDFDVSLADCSAVPWAKASSWTNFLCSGHYIHHLSFLRNSVAFSLASFDVSIISCGVK